MIKVLQNWAEIGECWMSLCRKHLPLHETPQKNWDHELLRRLVESLPRDGSRVVDLGCGGGFTLGFLHALGFRDLVGLDLNIEGRMRLKTWARMVRGRTPKPPWQVRRRDITRTGLEPGTIDLAANVSVIEHGVPRQAFLAECARILKPGGLLFVTTDYWEAFPSESKRGRAFNQNWEPFSRPDLELLLKQADEVGLELVDAGPVPACGEATVHWMETDYTFAAVAWRRRPR